MSLETLVQYWRRPRSQEEEAHWERLENILNARLLEGEMRTDALRSQRGGKDVFNAGMRLIEGVSEWIFEMYEAEKNG